MRTITASSNDVVTGQNENGPELDFRHAVCAHCRLLTERQAYTKHQSRHKRALLMSVCPVVINHPAKLCIASRTVLRSSVCSYRTFENLAAWAVPLDNLQFQVL